MRISVLQQKLRVCYNPQTESPSPQSLKEQAELSLADTFALLDEAGRRGSDLAVTVEAVNVQLLCTDTRLPYAEVYEGIDGATVRRFSEKAKEWKMHIVAGLYLTMDGKTYNCAVLFDDEGKIVGIHRKVHLPAGEELQVAHGDQYEVFETKLGRIGMLVCWDMQFPEAARIQALQDAELIALPTLGWENIYGLCRAYENSVPVAVGMGFTRDLPDGCDPSCVVDNMGKIVASAKREEHLAVVTCDLDIHEEPAPQYGSEDFIDSRSMRKTRLLQRRPQTYGLLDQPLEETPLYRRYFKEK